MPFEGISLRKYLPNSNLDKAIGTLQSFSGGNESGQRAGLARLRGIQESEELERDRQFQEQQKREAVVSKIRQDRFAESIKQYKESSDPRERAGLRAGMVLQMHKLGLGADDMDTVLGEIESTPLQKTPEQEQDLKDLSEQEMEVFKNSKPETKQDYVRAIRAGVPKERAQLLLEPDRKIKLQGFDSENDVYAVDEQGNRTLVSKGIPKGPKKTAKQIATEAENDKRIEAAKRAREKLKENPTLENKLEAAKTAIFAHELYGHDSVIQRRKLDALEVPEVALRRFDKAGKGVIELLEKDSAAGTLGASAAKSVRSFTETLKGLESLIPDWEGGFQPSRGKYQRQLEQLAGANDELQSRYYGIAYLNIIANGLSNQRVTNKMFTDALNDAKGTAGAPQAIKNKMNQIRERLVARVDAEADTILGDTEALTREFQFEDEQNEETSARDAYLQRLREAAAKGQGR